MSSRRQEPDPRDVRYLQFVTDRLHGLSDTEIAKKWGLSPRALYQSLSIDGYPVCPVCGTAPVASEHCKQLSDKRERLARGAGTVEDLPPAEAATPLFRERLAALLRATEDLEHRRESLQGGRFTSWYVYDDPVYFPRESFFEEKWRELCEQHGHDPNEKGFLAHGLSTQMPAGGPSAPAEPLPTLVAMYLLAGGKLDPLLQALHPDLGSADRHKINKLLDVSSS